MTDPRVARNDNSGFARRLAAALVFFSLLFTLPASRLSAATQLSHTTKTDWQSGILVNATWYPETQLQLDWEGSAGGASTPTAGVPWLAGWKFRRRITINNSLGYGLSDYRVWIPTSAFGSAWTLIRSSAQTTMADFRFTPSTATTTIPYWIDSDTNTPNGFRVKISTLLAGNNTIYMYYGNPSAVVGSSVTAVWGSGLVGYWAFGEGSGTTAKDASGNNNNGTLTNSPTWVAGKYGIALSFNGSNNYVISPTAGFSTGNASRTMECWVRTASADTLHVITYGTLTVNTGSFIYMAGGKMMMGFYSNDLDSGFSINNSIWRHIVFTFDGSTVRTYVDGINGATASKTAATATGTSFYAGQRGDSIYYLPGSIDEIRIYNRALSESEIKSRYAATEPTISSVGNEEGAFFSTGTYRSAVTDTASKIVVSSVSWNPATQPTSTQLAVSIRASKNSFAADAASPPWSQITNGSNPGIVGRYIQYASTFTTSVTTSTPRLEDITLTYKLAKPWKEKSIVRTGTSAYGFYGGDDWTWEVPVKGGQLVTITSYIRYNTQYSGGTFDKPKLTLSGLGINESISATAGAENSWEQRQLSGTPSADGILILRAEGFSTNAGARFYIDDINVLQ